MDLTRRGFLRLAAGVVLLPSCDKLGRELHIHSAYLPTPERPLTPTSEFYVVHNFGEPSAPSAAAFRLRVHGLVGRELTLGMGDLAAFPETTREVTLECIGNTPGGGLISSAAFTGVRLRDVLAEARPSDRARGVHLEGEDGYFAYLPVESALADEALLCHAINGEPLPPRHGAPLRALFPGRHGMFSVKWLHTITLARNWGSYGALSGVTNVVEGVTPVRSRIDVPHGGAEIIAGAETQLGGLALSAGAGIARVEVQVEGEWRPAEIVFNTLDDDRSSFLWSLWRLRFTPTRAGETTLAVRAFDREGRTQRFEPRFPYDSGAIHTVRVLVRG